MSEQQSAAGQGSGLAPNIASFLCYLGCWITGLIFILIEKENKEVRFHAWQSLSLGVVWFIIWVGITILSFIPFVNVITLFITPILWIGGLVLYIVLLVKAYQGQHFKLPYIGDFAEKQLTQ